MNRKRLRGVLGIAFLAPLLVVLGATSASADIDPDKTEEAVVQLSITWTGQVTIPYNAKPAETVNVEVGFDCSGFVISPVGHIATAAHCVTTDDDVKKAFLEKTIVDYNLVGVDNKPLDPASLDWTVTIQPTPRVQVSQPSSIQGRMFDEPITAQLLDTQTFETGDNALLQVANFDTSKAILPIAASTPPVLTDIVAIGFPGNTRDKTDRDRQDPTLKSYKVSSHITTKQGVPMLQLDGQIQQGMSGRPPLDAKTGAVVGVNSSLFLGTTQSYISDTVQLRTFLSKNGVGFTTAGSASTPAPSGSSPPVVVGQGTGTGTGGFDASSLVVPVLIGFVILILLIVVAIVVGVILFLRHRRKVAARTAPVAQPVGGGWPGQAPPQGGEPPRPGYDERPPTPPSGQ